MENYRISPAQLQAWHDASLGKDIWLHTRVEVHGQLSSETILERLKILSQKIELLRIRMIETEDINIPVQQLCDWREDDNRFEFSHIKNPSEQNSIIEQHKAIVNSQQVIFAVGLSYAQESSTIFVTTSRTHFDITSTKQLAELIVADTVEEPETQFIDFSEWLQERFAENPGGRSFWQDRLTLPSLPLNKEPSNPCLCKTDLIWHNTQDQDSWWLNVLEAWLQVLHQRLELPSPLRLDLLLSYRSQEGIDALLGPLSVRVPLQLNLDVSELHETLLKEYQSAEDKLLNFDLTVSKTKAAPIVFEVTDPNVESSVSVSGVWLQASVSNQRLTLTLHHCQNLIPKPLAEVILEALKLTLLGKATLSPKELHLQTELGTGPQITEPTQDPITLLQQRVNEAPNASAISLNQEVWSRQQLWAHIHFIAKQLHDQGIGKGQHVGVILPKNHKAIASLFAILNVGAVFVPLDSDWPYKRVHDILTNAKIQCVITNQSLAKHHKLSSTKLPILTLDKATSTNASIHTNTVIPLTDVDANDPGYIIHTSGSTGTPKGVVVPRIALSYLARALSHSVHKEQTSQQRWFTVNAPLIFDASLKQIVMLLEGGALWLVSEDIRRQPSAMLQRLHEDKVDCLDCTPTHLRLLLEASKHDNLPLPPTVVVGGEPIEQTLWDQLSQMTETRFINVYGPTEATVVSTYSPVTADLAPGIGQPLPGCRLWIRDENGQPLPTGAIGELWIGGDRLASHYLGLPEATLSSFVPLTPKGERAYRSGDYARWLSDGRLAFCGRKDQQIKLRGHRIELGEIESALVSHPAVHNAVAIVEKNANNDPSLTAAVEIPSSVIDLNHLLPKGQSLAEQTSIETNYLYKEIFIDETYANHGVIVPEGGTVFDVGANIGMFSIWAKLRWPSINIHAYEPVPEVVQTCSKNLGALDNVTLHAFGLSDKSGELDFIHYPNYSMMSGIAAGADSEYERQLIRQQLEHQVAAGDKSKIQALENLDKLLTGRFDAEHISVPVKTLSAEFARLGIKNIDLLKIDVQRSELDILNGLSPADLEKVNQLVMEVHDAVGTPTQGRIDLIMEMLEEAGFEVRANQEADLAGTDRFTLVAWRNEWREKVKDSYQPQPLCSTEELFKWLGERLPDYAMPHQICIIDSFPLTASGKIDRKALAATLLNTHTSNEQEMPSTELEKHMLALWKRVLHCDELGVTDSFFQRGGDSITGIRLQVEAKDEGLHFELPDLFKYQTIRKLAEHTKVAEVASEQIIPPFSLLDNANANWPEGVVDAYPMSGLAQGMLYHVERTGNPRTYHNVTAMHLQAPYRPELLQKAWQACVSRHDALRTSFQLLTQNGPVQLIHDTVSATVECIDWSETEPLSIKLATNQLMQLELDTAFSISHPPLVRIRMCKLPDDEIVIFIAEHHAILDGLSLELLRNELLDRYKALINGEQLTLPELTCRPAHFIQHQQEALRGDLSPWKNTLENAKPLRLLPTLALTQTSIPDNRNYVREERTIDTTLYLALQAKAIALGVHLKHVLMAVHAAVLGQWTGVNDVLTGLVVHGRPSLRDSDKMLGLFIHTLPIRLQITDCHWDTLIKQAQKEDERAQEFRQLPVSALRQEFGSSADIHTFINYVAFEETPKAYPQRAEYLVAVDVDMDLAVDFIVDNHQLKVLHQYPRAVMENQQTEIFFALTLETLEEAANPKNPTLLPPSTFKNVSLLNRETSGMFREPIFTSDASDNNIRIVQSIFQELLQVEKVTPSSDFFELGGHSLLALQAVHKLREATGVPIKLNDFQTATSVTQIAMLLTEESLSTALENS